MRALADMSFEFGLRVLENPFPIHLVFCRTYYSVLFSRDWTHRFPDYSFRSFQERLKLVEGRRRSVAEARRDGAQGFQATHKDGYQGSSEIHCRTSHGKPPIKKVNFNIPLWGYVFQSYAEYPTSSDSAPFALRSPDRGTAHALVEASSWSLHKK